MDSLRTGGDLTGTMTLPAEFTVETEFDFWLDTDREPIHVHAVLRDRFVIGPASPATPRTGGVP